MNCRRCGTAVVSGLRLCVGCALKHGEGPVFTMDLAPKQRPPYEAPLPNPLDGDTDAASPADREE
jgi:hypothetical protein